MSSYIIAMACQLKPAVEDAVVVEGVVVGVDFSCKMSQDHYLARVVK